MTRGRVSERLPRKPLSWSPKRRSYVDAGRFTSLEACEAELVFLSPWHVASKTLQLFFLYSKVDIGFIAESLTELG